MGIAVVTGAASGIGMALARRLATRGHEVHLVDVAPTTDLATELAGVSHTADVASAEDMERVARSTEEAEIVCLNAGIVGTSLGVPWEVPVAEWQRMWGVNVLGVVNGLQAFAPRMSARRRGQILITGSLAGLVTFPSGGAYAATKHAVVALAESASLALQGTAVTVTLACPALVRTGMSEVGANPDDVAAEVLAAADNGRFLVMPAEWAPAVIDRAERLVSGATPEVPAT
ncbi:MAG TPA: SDR family oxidoreductase [Propionibacteriaceae bacterium]|nr:SDR family oxidoreductase [Propionibacteriaceae bacterium]